MSQTRARTSVVLEEPARELAEAAAAHPRIYEVPPEQGRRALAEIQAGKGIAKPAIDEEWVDVPGGPNGPVRARIVRPRGATGTLPVVIYIHGAGWVFGDENTHDRLVRELAVGVDAAVVFPVYDLAPEAKYPVQIQQNYVAGQWVMREGARHGLDASRVAVAGDSVGGNMATVFAMMAKRRGDIALKAQVLLYPALDAGLRTGSYQEFAEGYYLTRDEMRWFWEQYLTRPEQAEEPYACPIRATPQQLRELPPTLVVTDEADVLRDEGETYAAMLRQAGVTVTALRVEGIVHDFLMLDSLRNTKAAGAGRRLAIDALRNALYPRD